MKNKITVKSIICLILFLGGLIYGLLNLKLIGHRPPVIFITLGLAVIGLAVLFFISIKNGNERYFKNGLKSSTIEKNVLGDKKNGLDYRTKEILNQNELKSIIKKKEVKKDNEEDKGDKDKDFISSKMKTKDINDNKQFNQENSDRNTLKMNYVINLKTFFHMNFLLHVYLVYHQQLLPYLC